MNTARLRYLMFWGRLRWKPGVWVLQDVPYVGTLGQEEAIYWTNRALSGLRQPRNHK